MTLIFSFLSSVLIRSLFLIFVVIFILLHFSCTDHGLCLVWKQRHHKIVPRSHRICCTQAALLQSGHPQTSPPPGTSRLMGSAEHGHRPPRALPLHQICLLGRLSSKGSHQLKLVI